MEITVGFKKPCMPVLLFCCFGHPHFPVMNASSQAEHRCQVMTSISKIPSCRHFFFDVHALTVPCRLEKVSTVL